MMVKESHLEAVKRREHLQACSALKQPWPRATARRAPVGRGADGHGTHQPLKTLPKIVLGMENVLLLLIF